MKPEVQEDRSAEGIETEPFCLVHSFQSEFLNSLYSDMYNGEFDVDKSSRDPASGVFVSCLFACKICF